MVISECVQTDRQMNRKTDGRKDRLLEVQEISRKVHVRLLSVSKDF